MKILFELNELTEEREVVRLERENREANGRLLKEKGYILRRKQRKLQKQNYKLRELRINEQYNLRYRKEKHDYLINLEAKKACYNLLN